MTPRLLITPGEPAGIGPDILVQLMQKPPRHCRLAAVADPDLIAARAELLGLPLAIINLREQALPAANEAGVLPLIPVSAEVRSQPGQLNRDNAAYVLETLRQATDRVLAEDYDALVTGPVHKGVINDAGIAFSGHTEFLAEHCDRQLTVMMLATEGLRVALVTTHLPLAEVAAAISSTRLRDITEILHQELQQRFGISEPKILVCGLNPHAGESGHLGREEIEVIEPTLNELRQQGMDLVGPLPADTLFTPDNLRAADAVLAMYHDQGLPVLKYKGFGDACNITLGLPIVRTSVDHGTALDLAGSGEAKLGSLLNAIDTAVIMAQRGRQS